MNALKNNVRLIGNLGAAPEVKEVSNGKKLAKIRVATNEGYKNANGDWVEETTWHNCVAWGKTAEIAESYLKKGSEVCLQGKLSNRSYEDKEGVTRYISEVIISDLLLMGKKDS